MHVVSTPLDLVGSMAGGFETEFQAATSEERSRLEDSLGSAYGCFINGDVPILRNRPQLYFQGGLLAKAHEGPRGGQGEGCGLERNHVHRQRGVTRRVVFIVTAAEGTISPHPECVGHVLEGELTAGSCGCGSHEDFRTALESPVQANGLTGEIRAHGHR